MYKKKHQAHTWLVYGYEKEKQSFHIIEHSVRDNLFYRKKSVSFAELEVAYTGYLALSNKTGFEMTYYEFEQADNDQEGIADYRAIYERYVMSNMAHIQKGLKILRDYINAYRKLTEKQFFDTIVSRVDAFNDIINAKKIICYRCRMLYSEQSGKYEKISNILRQYQKVRGIIVKIQYTGVYRKKDIQDSVFWMEDIYRMEQEYLDMFLNDLSGPCGL